MANPVPVPVTPDPLQTPPPEDAPLPSPPTVTSIQDTASSTSLAAQYPVTPPGTLPGSSDAVDEINEPVDDFDTRLRDHLPAEQRQALNDFCLNLDGCIDEEARFTLCLRKRAELLGMQDDNGDLGFIFLAFRRAMDESSALFRSMPDVLMFPKTGTLEAERLKGCPWARFFGLASHAELALLGDLHHNGFPSEMPTVNDTQNGLDDSLGDAIEVHAPSTAVPNESDPVPNGASTLYAPQQASSALESVGKQGQESVDDIIEAIVNSAIEGSLVELEQPQQ